MSNSNKYAGPTKDGRFKGTKILCATCGFAFRRHEMIKQDGYLVCLKHCYDNKAQEAKPQGYTFS